MFVWIGIVLFWGSLLALAYTFIGYAIVMGILGKCFARQVQKAHLSDTDLPEVTVLLVACNEAERIAARLDNLLSADYPREKLSVLVVSDGSEDGMNARVQQYPDERVRLLALPERKGKANGLNCGMAAVTSPVVVYADARQRFEPQAIRELVAHFNDEKVGAVSGALEIVPSDPGVASGVGIYWKLEKFIRCNEGLTGSCMGCTGAIYAIRSKLFQPMPEDTLIDDVYTPMRVIEQGYRVTFEPSAVAIDPQPLDPDKERIRKPRTLAGNYQLMMRYPQWCLPFAGRTPLRLISHKYLRLFGPLMLGMMLVGNGMLLALHPLYWALMLGQVAYYAIAIYGLLAGGKGGKRQSIPASFLFLNYTAALGAWLYFSGRYKGAWQMASSAGKKT